MATIYFNSTMRLQYEDEAWGDVFGRLANCPAVLAFSFARCPGEEACDVSVKIDEDADSHALDEVAKALGGCRTWGEFERTYVDELAH